MGIDFEEGAGNTRSEAAPGVRARDGGQSWEGHAPDGRLFGDAGVQGTLKARVYPALLQGRDEDAPLRIWVPDCGRGQDVYALAIGLIEAMAELQVSCPVQIFATETNDAALEEARSGLFGEDIARDVSPECLRRFFSNNNNARAPARVVLSAPARVVLSAPARVVLGAPAGYQVRKSVRDLCIFARHDLVGDPPYAGLDLVYCPSLLDRPDPQIREQALAHFHYALKPSGFLVLGAAPTEGVSAKLFDLLDAQHGIFLRLPGSPRPRRESPWARRAASRASVPPAGDGEPAPVTAAQRALQEADRLVLSRYSPPGVVIDQDLRIVQFRGHTGVYLEPPQGEPSHQLLDMVHRDLAPELKGLILKARHTDEAVRGGPLQIRAGGAVSNVLLEVVPLRPGARDEQHDGPERHYLVLFEEQRGAVAPDPAPPQPGAEDAAAPEQPATPSADSKVVTRLRRELRATRENMQSIIDELMAANEELQSSNEEILASNEELQSLHEQFDAFREELRSSNDDLIAVNHELKRRNEDLTRLNHELDHALSSFPLPFVIVGTDLRIRRFTPAGAERLGLTPEDVGRFIGDLRLGLETIDLETRMAEVIDTMTPFEGEVRDRRGHWCSIDIRPCRAPDNTIGGASLLLVDVDQLKRSLEQAEQRLAAARATPQPPR